MSDFFKNLFGHKIMDKLVAAHGPDVQMKWQSFDAVVFPSGVKGFAGKVLVSAPGFDPTVFTFTADSQDWRLVA